MRSRALFVSLALWGCGARTEPAMPEAPSSDAGPALEPRLAGVWRFNTVRALCDTLAVAVCADAVRVRLSVNDLCEGENPVDAAPVRATVLARSADTLRIRVALGGIPAELELSLVEGVARPSDRLELEVIAGPLTGFPWSSGTRDETLEAPLSAEFITCGS